MLVDGGLGICHLRNIYRHRVTSTPTPIPLQEVLAAGIPWLTSKATQFPRIESTGSLVFTNPLELQGVPRLEVNLLSVRYLLRSEDQVVPPSRSLNALLLPPLPEEARG